jgi:choline dehydrogenase-like flavoprotein
MTDEYDAVIIGTGAGGAPLLARLAGAGLRVLALEAGAEHPPSEMPTDERAQSGLFWNDERLSAGANPLAFGNNNSGCGVGGSTLHFTAYTPRPQPDDFALHREFGVGCDWPLSYADLEPYFDELEAFLGVSGPSDYPWGPPRRASYPHPPLPLNAAAQLMERGCAALGITTSPAPNAALSRPQTQEGYGSRPACTNRGFCQAGCSVGAKASMDVTFLPLARSCGAEIRAECFVSELETQGDRVTSVVYHHAGREHRVRASAVFLCAGAIETPRILLRLGVANRSGQVGRNFMAHVGTQVWGTFDDAAPPYKGIPGGLISEAMHRPKDADFAGGYLLQSIGVMPVTYVSQFARGTGMWGAALHDHMRGYTRTAGINILGEGLPYGHNYVELSDEPDARGFPKPRIHFTAGDNELRMQAHAERVMLEIWTAAGGQDLWTFKRFAHIIGTARMGANPGSSVVNPSGRCHDLTNLYISDNSTFPSALSVNPSLTIMALALRTADLFLAQSRAA